MKYKNKIFVLLLLVLLSICSITMSFANSINENDEGIVIDKIGNITFVNAEVTLIKSEGGTYSAQVPIYEKNSLSASASSSAVMTWTLNRDASYSNVYSIDYCIVATTLVNGVYGDLKISNTSLLFPVVYVDKPYSKTFTASTLYYGNAGILIVPEDEDKVKLTFKNTAIYFLSDGWLSGLGFSGTYVLE